MKTREEKKLTVNATAELFGINPATIFRWQKRIEPCKKRNRLPRKINMEELQKDVELYPNAFQRERAVRLKVSPTCVLYALRRLNIR